MLSRVDVLLNDVGDVLLELEDGVDVLLILELEDVLHAVSPPLSFKIVMIVYRKMY